MRIFLSLLALVLLPSSAAATAYVKIGDIKGESLDAQQEEQMPQDTIAPTEDSAIYGYPTYGEDPTETQIDPPSLELDAGPSDLDPNDVLLGGRERAIQTEGGGDGYTDPTVQDLPDSNSENEHDPSVMIMEVQSTQSTTSKVEVRGWDIVNKEAVEGDTNEATHVIQQENSANVWITVTGGLDPQAEEHSSAWMRVQQVHTDASGEATTDIVLKGKKILQNFTEQMQEEVDEASVYLEKTVRTRDDLELYSAALITTDENIEEVMISEEGISLDYQHPAKLLGLFPVTLHTTATVDNEGRVKVKMPWWRILTRHYVGSLKEEIELELEDSVPDSPAKQQQTLQTISNVSKMLHDTAMAVIRKIGG